MRRYSVFSTDQFDEGWQRAVNEGAFDPEAGESKLEELANFLSVDPKYFEMFDAPGESVDLRWIHFISTDVLRVEIWYSVVEDDLAVYLESLEVIPRSQQSLPGFDF